MLMNFDTFNICIACMLCAHWKFYQCIREGIYTFVSLNGWHISSQHLLLSNNDLHFLIRVFVTQINEMKTDEIDFCL